MSGERAVMIPCSRCLSRSYRRGREQDWAIVSCSDCPPGVGLVTLGAMTVVLFMGLLGVLAQIL